MIEPAKPENEAERLAALNAVGLLDTAPEERFDRITHLVKTIFDVPIVLVSLVDKHRQWFKSIQGLDVCETPRNISFCGHAILQENIFYIPDTIEDPRFTDNPLVTGPPNIRTYAGAPLTTSLGYRIGTLCIIDNKPRNFTANELLNLRNLADWVQFELERFTIKQAVQNMNYSEIHTRSVLDTVVDGVIIIDNKGVIQRVNPAAEQIFNYTTAELAGQDIKKLMPEPYTSHHDKYIKNYLDTGEAKIIGIGREVEGKRKDGGTFAMELAVSEMQIGEQLRFVGTVRDITERKKADEDLRKYAKSLESLHSITSRIDLDFHSKVVELLKLGCDTFKLPIGILSHISGDTYTIKHIVAPEGAPQPGTAFPLGDTYCKHTLTANEPTGFHHTAVSEIRDHPCYLKFKLESYIGTPLMVDGIRYGTLNFSNPDSREQPFSDSDFSLIQLFSQWIGNEMARRRDDIALQEATALRQAILDSANVSIISTDVDGTIRTFNKGAERLLGYHADELVANTTPAIIHDAEEVKVRAVELSKELGQTVEPGFESFVAKARRGRADEREWTYVRKDGTRFPVLLSVTAVRNTGNEIIGFLGIGTDLTERKKVEQLKNEFVSTVSHELRTPLTSIRGSIGLVLGKFGNEFPLKVKHMLEVANRNSERLTLLINDILDLEKLETGQLEFEFETFDLVDLAQQALEANEGYARKHNVKVQITDKPERVIVRGDEHRLLQVFANLISNAVKFSPKNGVVDVNIHRHGDYIRTSIRDHGAGIPPEFRSRIFQRFAQVDSSDSRQKGGTGLGLTITKAIVSRHGGHIDYKSDKNFGTDFYFDIPVWEGVCEIQQHDADKPDVLICEDDHDVAMLFTSLLKNEGMRCDVAPTAKRGKEMLEKHEYRLMLLDLKLPDMDGLQLLREIRTNERTSELPVIVVSARAVEGRDQINGESVSVVDWIQKPVEKKRLSTALKIALRGNKLPKVLHIEDDLDIVQIVQSMLESVSEFQYVTTLEGAIQQLSNTQYDLVILDLALPDGSGIELLGKLKGKCPVVIFSAQEPTVEVTRRVAATLTKSKTGSEQLVATVKRVLNQY